MGPQATQTAANLTIPFIGMINPLSSITMLVLREEPTA
jgi:hypothetical protein